MISDCRLALSLEGRLLVYSATRGPRMPRYFFHVRYDNHDDRDPDGLDLPNLETAIAEGNRARRELMAEHQLDRLRLEIEDRNGRVLARLG